jgi:tetratricopeptide (TPR) repeat protein
MARRIAFELATVKITPSWRSYQEYSQAIDELHARDAETAAKVPQVAQAPGGGAGGQAVAQPPPPNRQAQLEQARDGFQRALDFDQGNLMARFNLATVQRKLGDNDAAESQFAFVERMIDNALPDSPLDRFRRKYPEFKNAVRYNRAGALTKRFSRRAHDEADRILTDLIKLPPDPLAGAAKPAGVDEMTESQKLDWQRARTRIQWLARSAHAALLVVRLEYEEAPARREQYTDQLQQHRQWLEKLVPPPT